MRIVAALLCLLIASSSLADEPERDVRLRGFIAQGALVIGEAEPGTQASLDGTPLMVSASGVFAFGFDRDHGPKAQLQLRFPDGRVETKSLNVAPRTYDIQRVDGVAPKFVNPPAEELARIARDAKKKKAARSVMREATWFEEAFIWPAKGPVSGVFGSQRFYNGEPRRPHYGVDIAAPLGAPILAPADGIVTLAESDMYFEGGLVFIDHGQGVTSYYMHMSRVDVKVGSMVHRGEIIGAVGASGRATGPHLHWAMFWRDAHLDPSLLIPGIAAQGPEPGTIVGE